MKKQNDIILAPVTSQAAEIYSLWEMNHTGRLTDFYNFMVNPSAERSVLLPLWKPSLSLQEILS